MEYNFLEILIFVLLALLFAKEQLFAWVGKKFNLKGSVTERKMDTLAHYFNHDTTAHLTKLHDTSEETLQILKEFKEYGIRIRK